MIVEVENFFDKEIKVFIPKKFEDDRGFFSEKYNKKDYLQIGIEDDFVQDNFSYSLKKGTLRGLHFQNPPSAQSKIVHVTNGRILDVVVDLRKNSKTFGKYITCELSKENFKHIYIPSCFAHGFCTLEDNTEVYYKTSNFYSAKNEKTIAWNDQKISINWNIPQEQLIISEKDKMGININDFVSPF
tara:strand:- start:2 stop:559 length:558 start_codon:yes stop_codon:yes gene_type:complete